MSSFAEPPPPNPVSPSLDMSIITEAFEILKLRLKPMASVSAVFFVLLVVLVGILMAVWFGTLMAVIGGSGNNPNPFALMIAIYGNPAFWLMVFVGAMVPIYLQAAIVGMTFKHLRGEEPTFADGMDAVKANFGALTILGLMSAAINMFTSIAGLFIQAAIFISVPAIIDQKLKPIDAMKYSYETVKSQYWMVFGLYFLSALIGGLGTIACYVGYIFTAPFIGLVPALVYWKLRGNMMVSFHGASPYPRGGEAVSTMGTPPPAMSEVPRPESMYSEPAPIAPPAPAPESAAPPVSHTPDAPPVSDSGEFTQTWSSEMPPVADSGPSPMDPPSTSQDSTRPE